VLSLQSNSFCAAGGKALAEGLKDNQVITELNISSNHLGLSNPRHRASADMSGVIALADVIPDMGSLSSLNLASNNLGTLASDDGWTMNSGGAYCSPEGKWQGGTKPDGIEFKPLGVIAVANAIKDMRALTQLMFGDKQVVTMTTEMTEANFSGKLKSFEAQIVAAFLPKCTRISPPGIS
jgi:hypothetical protein